MEKCWQMDDRELVRRFDTDLSRGLSSDEALRRTERFGPNQLKEKPAHSPLRIFLEQFDDFIIWVLVAAALVSGILREWVDAIAIVAIVIINSVLGFLQEYRAEKSLAALRKLSAPNARVVRDGEHCTIPAQNLVPGDIIELEAGDHITADARIVSATTNFATLEASLTGEAQAVVKTALVLDEEDVPLADRANMVYRGTSVAAGKAKAVVIATGMATELGKIAGMIQEIVHEATPLQRKLEEFGRWIVYLCIVLVAVVFLLEFLRGGNLLDIFLTAVSLAVAAIPEGLPAVVTIALALGVQRMVKRHALIRKLPSVETLGAATVICSDKTGTLTKNEMTVRSVFTLDAEMTVTGTGYAPSGDFRSRETVVDPRSRPVLMHGLECGVLCNGSYLVNEKGTYRIAGDPTEGALLTLAAKAGIERKPLEEVHSFVEEIPFDSERKIMTIIRRSGENFTAYVKGAPDILLGRCISVEEDGKVRPLTEADRAKILGANTVFGNEAMRVLAVAYRPLAGRPADVRAETIERDLVFVSLVAMIDPPRDEVREAIQKCATAGIRTVMITGDHIRTAVAIARQLGFFFEDSVAVTGEELDRMSDDELYENVGNIQVYARVAPEHKLRIVKAWRRHGHVVAMTGDGVNDAPAVKEADIGVAMGIAGTDVTKEVADMVVTDDNFASIVAAVEEGRGIYDNIRKFIHYLLSCNAGEILTMFVASVAALPVPLLPIHILWINLVTDGLPALALGVDPVDPHIMQRPPRPLRESVVTQRRAALMLVQGSFIAFCSLLAFVLVLFVEKEGMARARTAAFIVLACSQLFHAFNCRNQKVSIFKLGVFSNMKLVQAFVVSFLLQMSVVYVPFLQKVFKTEALGLGDWVMVIIISSFPLWAMELVKSIPGYGMSGKEAKA